MSAIASILTDQPLDVQPGQLSADDFAVRVYKAALGSCYQQLDELPSLLMQGKISVTVYYTSDAHLCRMADVFADCLTRCGLPQPTRIR